MDARCLGVSAPDDERILHLDLEITAGFRSGRRTIVVELATNQWNVLVVDGADRILSVLRRRAAGQRVLVPGARYSAPAQPQRYGFDNVPKDAALRTWSTQLCSIGPNERLKGLLGSFAYTSAINGSWILTPAEREEPESSEEWCRQSFERWWWLRGAPVGSPYLLRLGGKDQPYPFPLNGIEGAPVTSLLAAMDRVAAGAAGGSGDVARPISERPEESGGDAAHEGLPRASVFDLEAAQAFVQDGRLRLERKVDRLRRELAKVGEADRIRSWGDLLLARLHQVQRGMDSVRLEGWEGEEVEIPLDPRLSPAENADRHYAQAGRRKRAEEQIPLLIEATERDLARWRDAEVAIPAGAVPSWVSRALERREPADRGDPRKPAPALPYRLFRTSGGLEVRVGKSSRENDRLTFRESAPTDVWLHARSVPGSHVILRWSDAEAAPPSRDLLEAAQLAALFSRARTSGTVAVDWTRRKHVRKPRGAPPGTVIPQQVRTLFVEPDEEVARRLEERI